MRMKPHDPEAPELGRPGSWQVGTGRIGVVIDERIVLSLDTFSSGSFIRAPEELKVRIWYPAATGATGAPAHYNHVLNLPGGVRTAVSSTGFAIENATAVRGPTFPLVVLSHGFGGWCEQFSRLGEHLASRGYFVASIDHGDRPAATVPEFLLSFGSVLANRALDQRAVINALQIMARAQDPRLPCQIDARKLALIGYSMGGYGALNTAGARYSFSCDPSDKLPTGVRDILNDASSVPLNALVLFAPWGGQPASRAWKDTALNGVRTPTLLVSGSQDDVVDHEHGVSWIFDNLSHAERHLLTFREARHNIFGDPFDLTGLPFIAREFLAEPVWRSERLNVINQHFVTAFLDLHMKGCASSAGYLEVPCEDANRGIWPVSLGELTGDMLAGQAQGSYWPGFPRRWAAGVSLQRERPASA